MTQADESTIPRQWRNQAAERDEHERLTREQIERRFREEVDEDAFAAKVEADARRRDPWSALFAEWLRFRATMADPSLRDQWSDVNLGAHCNREDELARQIVTTPYVFGRDIIMKFDVVERHLEDSRDWTDQRLILFLGALKADIVRYIAGSD